MDRSYIGWRLRVIEVEDPSMIHPKVLYTNLGVNVGPMIGLCRAFDVLR